MDFFFVPFRPSTVALAAILNAMESLPSVPYSAQMSLMAHLFKYGINPYTKHVNECRARIRLHYEKGGYAPPSSGTSNMNNTQTGQEDRDISGSPVCVTQVPTSTTSTSTTTTTTATTTYHQHEVSNKVIVDERQEDNRHVQRVN
jgi:hypothetical protein